MHIDKHLSACQETHSTWQQAQQGRVYKVPNAPGLHSLGLQWLWTNMQQLLDSHIMFVLLRMTG
jgi:hypothetical protein